MQKTVHIIDATKTAGKSLFLIVFVTFVFLLGGIGQARAEDYVINLQGTEFSPTELVIPAGQKVKVIVKNNTDVAAEFESDELHREKVIAPQKEGIVFIGPLDAGTYSYLNDFHPATTGKITAK